MLAENSGDVFPEDSPSRSSLVLTVNACKIVVVVTVFQNEQQGRHTQQGTGQSSLFGWAGLKNQR